MRFSLLLALVAGSSAAQVFNGGRRGRGDFDWPSVERVTQVAVGAQTVSALYSFVAPKENLNLYGVSNPDQSTIAFMRTTSAVQLAGAAVVATGEVQDIDITATVALASSAVALMMALPGLERLDVDKEMVARWIVVLVALGKLTLDDRFSGFNPAVVICGLVGGQFYLKPKFTAETYNIRGASRVGLDLLKLGGANLFAIGAYLIGAREKSHGYGLATYLGLNALSALKYAIVDAKAGGVKVVGPAMWAVAQGSLSALAFKDADKDEGRGGRRIRRERRDRRDGVFSDRR